MRGNPHDDAGRAILEFIFLGIIVFVPLTYLVVAVFEVQRNVFAVEQAARQAGRAMATADDAEIGAERAQLAAALALADQGLPPEGYQVLYGQGGGGCGSAAAPAELTPGDDFTVCVRRTYTLPGVPGVLTGSDNTVTGQFVVHIDRFRTNQ